MTNLIVKNYQKEDVCGQVFIQAIKCQCMFEKKRFLIFNRLQAISFQFDEEFNLEPDQTCRYDFIKIAGAEDRYGIFFPLDENR